MDFSKRNICKNMIYHIHHEIYRILILAIHHDKNMINHFPMGMDGFTYAGDQSRGGRDKSCPYHPRVAISSFSGRVVMLMPTIGSPRLRETRAMMSGS